MTLPAGDLTHLRRACDLLDRDDAQPLDVPAMAHTALMSPAHFSRTFRAAYGETPYGYLMTRRIERAQAMLRLGTPSVTEVCFAVGGPAGGPGGQPDGSRPGGRPHGSTLS